MSSPTGRKDIAMAREAWPIALNVQVFNSQVGALSYLKLSVFFSETRLESPKAKLLGMTDVAAKIDFLIVSILCKTSNTSRIKIQV